MTVPASPIDSWREHRIIAVLCAIAVVVGVVFRFKGLGAAPFAPDEFFLARSIENVLQYGIPKYDCGGLYTRGVIIQYLAAGLQLLGFGPELALRSITAVASLATLPAVYLLARRLAGPGIGLLAVALLALSVWEIEMARFGRMYAPFQAVFAWYLVAFARYTVDGDRRALLPMLALTVLGPLTWEGGVFLAVANLLPPFLRTGDGNLQRRDYVYLAGMAILLAIAYWFVATDFRNVMKDSPWPAGYDPAIGEHPGSFLDAAEWPIWTLIDSSHPVWLLLPIGLLLPGLWSLRHLRSRPLALLGLLAASAAAAAGQLLLAASIPVLLMLTRIVPWDELRSREIWPLFVGMLACAIFWGVYAFVFSDWQEVSGGSSAMRGLALAAYGLLGFPDWGGVVALPWARAVPVLGGLLAIAILVAIVQNRRDDDWSGATLHRVLLIVFIALMLGAGASDPPRSETRYVFFLYPVALLIGLGAVVRATRGLRRIPPIWAYLLPITAFAVSEDFSPRHLARIDAAPDLRREEMSDAMQGHLVARNDLPALAAWLAKNVDTRSTIVVNAVQGLDHYYPGFDAFFVEWHDHNLAAYSCESGRIDRWSNLPLIYRIEDLERRAQGSAPLILVLYKSHLDKLASRFVGTSTRVLSSFGSIVVVAVSTRRDG